MVKYKIDLFVALFLYVVLLGRIIYIFVFWGERGGLRYLVALFLEVVLLGCGREREFKVEWKHGIISFLSFTSTTYHSAFLIFKFCLIYLSH